MPATGPSGKRLMSATLSADWAAISNGSIVPSSRFASSAATAKVKMLLSTSVLENEIGLPVSAVMLAANFSLSDSIPRATEERIDDRSYAVDKRVTLNASDAADKASSMSRGVAWQT